MQPNYIKIMNWFWEEVPYTDGYRPLYGVLLLAIIDGINKNGWRPNTIMDYERIINKCRFNKEVYLNGRKWLMDKQFIDFIPGKNNNQMACFSLGLAVGIKTAEPTAEQATESTAGQSSDLPLDLPNTKQQTNKPKNNKPKTITPASPELNIPFELFYNEYDKKVGSKEKLIKAWASLTDEEREKAMQHIPEYKKSRPDKQFRKDPSTYLNNKSFNDEIIDSSSNGNGTNNNQKNGFTVKGSGLANLGAEFTQELIEGLN